MSNRTKDRAAGAVARVPSEGRLTDAPGEKGFEREEASGAYARPTDPGGYAATQKWNELSTMFVDDPNGAVRAADEVIREQMHALINRLSDKRSQLALRWERDGASTEDLRQCFTAYRELARCLDDM